MLLTKMRQKTPSKTHKWPAITWAIVENPISTATHERYLSKNSHLVQIRDVSGATVTNLKHTSNSNQKETQQNDCSCQN